MRTVQDELKSLQDNQRLLAILVFSLVTIVIWVGFSLLNSQQKSSISPELKAMARPLNPNINTDVLDEINTKRFYSSDELASFSIYSVKLADQQKSVFSHFEPVAGSGTPASGSATVTNPLNSLNQGASNSATTNSATTSGSTAGP